MAKWMLPVVACLLISSASAQVQFGSLEELLKYAGQHTAIARQAKILVEASQEEIGVQRSGLLPKINIYGTADYYPIIATQLIPESVFGGQDGKFRKVQFGLPYGFSSGVELSMPLVNFEKWKQLEKSKSQRTQVEWTQKANIENLNIQLTRLYYQELAMKAAVKLNLQNQEVATKLMVIMDNRKENGVLNPSDYNRAKNLQLDVLKTRQEYERILREVRINLHAQLNLPDSAVIVILDSLPGFAWPQIEFAVTDISQRPGWKEVVSRTNVAQKQWEESKGARLPKLSFYGRYAYNWQMKFNPSTSIGFDVSSIGLRFDFPVFQGNYYSSLQKKNELLLASARLDEEKIGSALKQEQLEWWNNYRNASSQNSILLERMKVANDNLRIAGLSMREGIMEFNEFNEIFMEYNRAQLDYLQNLFDGILYYLLLTQTRQQS